VYSGGGNGDEGPFPINFAGILPFHLLTIEEYPIPSANATKEARTLNIALILCWALFNLIQ